jgi:hypothetical protein
MYSFSYVLLNTSGEDVNVVLETAAATANTAAT